MRISIVAYEGGVRKVFVTEIEVDEDLTLDKKNKLITKKSMKFINKKPGNISFGGWRRGTVPSGFKKGE